MIHYATANLAVLHGVAAWRLGAEEKRSQQNAIVMLMSHGMDHQRSPSHRDGGST
jgi:hypothetical protein